MEFKNIEVSHIHHAMRGMRNPMSGWDKSDTVSWTDPDKEDANGDFIAGGLVTEIGESDMNLAHRLVRAGSPHRKFMRQISVIVDICKMPSYLMIEFMTYKIGTTSDSSSTMHRIMSRPLTASDFEAPETDIERIQLGDTIEGLNRTRELYLDAKERKDVDAMERYFRSMKRMLPHSYIYERITWTCSYENLIEIWFWRHNHRLPAWHEFCHEFIEKLPYSELITKFPYEDIKT